MNRTMDDGLSMLVLMHALGAQSRCEHVRPRLLARAREKTKTKRVFNHGD